MLPHWHLREAYPQTILSRSYYFGIGPRFYLDKMVSPLPFYLTPERWVYATCMFTFLDSWDTSMPNWEPTGIYGLMSISVDVY